jgi:hypothetical protein
VEVEDDLAQVSTTVVGVLLKPSDLGAAFVRTRVGRELLPRTNVSEWMYKPRQAAPLLIDFAATAANYTSQHARWRSMDDSMLLLVQYGIRTASVRLSGPSNGLLPDASPPSAYRSITESEEWLTIGGEVAADAGVAEVETDPQLEQLRFRAISAHLLSLEVALSWNAVSRTLSIRSTNPFVPVISTALAESILRSVV